MKALLRKNATTDPPAHVVLSFDGGVGRIVIETDQGKTTLSREQALKLAESLREQAFHLRTVEG